MLNSNRIKIFMPFDSLKGFKESLERVEKLHENEFVEEEKIIDKIKKINIKDRVEVYYFYNFEYINTIGEVKNIDYKNKVITISNSKILFEEIDEIKKRLT